MRTANSKPEVMIYHNRSSTDYGILLQFPEPYIYSAKEQTQVHVPGRSGDIIEDNDAYQNPVLTVPFLVKSMPNEYDNWFQWNSAVAKWLKADGYDYLKFNYQDGYVWEAYPNQAPVVTPSSARSATGTFSFTVKPYLKRSDSVQMQDVPLGKGTIFNPEDEATWPDWQFDVGPDTKTFTLSVNGFPYEFNGVSGTVYVDGENCQVSSNGNFINDQINFANNDAPQLIQGENTISLSGDAVNSIKWRPNWRRLA